MITGYKEIDNVLRNLPAAVNHAVMQAAHVTAAKPLVSKMQLLAPEGPTGHLVDSIGIVRSSAKVNSSGLIRVGPRRRIAPHAHLVEYGTRRRRNRKGANRGIMPKHPFVKPAFDATKTQVEQGIAVATARSVLRTMRRYLK